MEKLLWITDLHYAEEPILGYDPKVRIRAAVSYINTNHADALGCVISGDLTEHGTVAEYQGLLDLLDDLAVPWFPMVGNHDDRANLRQVLPLPPGCLDGFLQYRMELGSAEILCLDTVKAGAPEGEFCTTRKEWLRRAVQNERNGPRLVFMHHPPLELGLPVMDPIRLLEADPFLRLITQGRAVQHLFCGHVHRAVTGAVEGVPFATLRSLVFQTPVPVPGWDWSKFIAAREAPEMGVILFNENNSIIIQYVQHCAHETGFLEGKD